MTQIYDFLFLGGKDMAADEVALQSLDIRYL